MSLWLKTRRGIVCADNGAEIVVAHDHLGATAFLMTGEYNVPLARQSEEFGVPIEKTADRLLDTIWQRMIQGRGYADLSTVGDELAPDPKTPAPEKPQPSSGP